MKKSFSFEYKISGIVILMLALVVFLGIHTYERFSTIVTNVSEATQPDLKLVTAKGLLVDLSEAEISVKSYTLTKDKAYIDRLEEITSGVQFKLEKLHEQIDADTLTRASLDSLDFHIEQKFYVLNELVNLQDQYRVKEVLNKVSIKIEEEANNLDTIITTVETKRKLFNWRKKTDTLIQIENNFDLEEVNRELKTIETSEKYRNKKILRRELELITIDRNITLKIRSILTVFEDAELNAIELQTSFAETEVHKINKQIAFYCAAICILLVLMTLVILNYVRNNNRYRKALKLAKIEAETLGIAKERFVATMSHEIRTPMNALAGFTEQIAKGPLSDGQREKVVMVQKSAEHLLDLVNEVLDLTKLQNNKLVLDKTPFSPMSVITDVLGFIQPLTEKKQIIVSSTFREDLPKALNGDPFRLRQILLNLLSNAVKFTPNNGTIVITVNWEPFGKKSMRLKMTVKDSGIGMTPEQLTHIFEEFEQAEASTASEYGGTGLGLAITKKIVDLHKGKITFISEPNKGTTVSLMLPYRVGKEEELKSKGEINEKVDFSGLRILVADDESYNRKLLISILKRKNAIITEVADGKAAVNLANSVNFDLVLMDIRMPILNGMEATKIIRETQFDLPIIGLTAGLNDHQSYIEAGMTRVIAKPFKEVDLLIEIGNVLNKTGPKQEVLVENKDVMSGNLDFSELKIISNGDQVFFREMLETFIKGTLIGVEELKEGVINKDWNTLAESSHKIAPSCKHLSAVKLYDLLKSIERNARAENHFDEIERTVLEVDEEAIRVMKMIEIELNELGD